MFFVAFDVNQPPVYSFLPDRLWLVSAPVFYIYSKFFNLWVFKAQNPILQNPDGVSGGVELGIPCGAKSASGLMCILTF